MPVPSAPFRVVVAGTGIAGVTALMVLADLGERRLQVDLVSPGEDFVLRPQLIGAPWGGRPLHTGLGELAADFGARHRRGTLARVDADRRTVTTTDGTEQEYDALLLAVGATQGIVYPGVWTIGFGGLPEALAHPTRGDVAVIVPPGTGWSLPAYQLALFAARTGDAPVRVITPEHEPLELFGPATTGAIRALLSRNGVGVETGVDVAPDPEVLHDLADHVVALPALTGPRITGLPSAAGGFIPVDARQRVAGLESVYAAGDASTDAIKQGGLAAHQAETAAADIVRQAGMSPGVRALPPVLRGKLVAGDEELYLRRALDDQDPGVASATPLWRPEASVLAWRPSRWLVARGAGSDENALGPLAHPAPAAPSPAPPS